MKNGTIFRRLAYLGALTLLVVAMFGATNAWADAISFTSPAVWPNADNEDYSLGWEFSVSGSVDVYALGYNYFNTPLNNSHQVGIYDSGGNLLASATVDNSSTASNGYLYTSLGSPLLLTSGNYFITGTTLGLNDGWIYQADNLVTDPNITYLDSWYTPGNGGMLGFPTTDTLGGRQYLDVNFTDAPSAVPEPSIGVLLGLSMCGLAILRRRKVS